MIAENPNNQKIYDKMDYTLDKEMFVKRYGKQIAKLLSGLISEKVGQEAARMVWEQKKRG
ncbi:hypothetical protein AAY24_18220 (plasmid) [Sedimenticola thiotaurini]|uniref:Uncharacterized protein n=2 Tax=Sedimenticola thiotaurini TaxID=1543721 RepID=A0A0F7K624_9GAMM|nr:hypothetical protein AAY24_18220 [Sedimenticola thiotaurini]